MRKILFLMLSLGATLILSACGGSSSSGKQRDYHYFYGQADEVSGQIWRTDGTEAGTTQVTRVPVDDGFWAGTPIRVGSRQFFVADDMDDHALWVIDNSTVGATRLIGYQQDGVANISQLTAMNGVLFFAATTEEHGQEIWRSNGTREGTFRVTNLAPGACSTYPSSLTVFNNRLFFAGVNSCIGRAGLWMTDGTETGTQPVPSLAPQGGSYPSNLTIFNGALYLSVMMGADRSLWRTDGTEEGTALVYNVRSDAQHAGFSEFAVVGNLLFFRANDGEHGLELWKSDGTESGTALVADINPNGGSSPHHLRAVGNQLVFAANSGGTENTLWKSDGTSEGTTQIRDEDGNLVLRPFTVTPYRGGLVFRALWDGAYPLFRLLPDSFDIHKISDGINIQWSPSRFAVINNALLFAADDGEHGNELWRSEGTLESTRMVKDICTGGCDGIPFREN